MVAVSLNLEPPLPAQGSLQLRVYDVGQGQAIELTTDSPSTEIRTGRHADTDEGRNTLRQDSGDVDGRIQTTRLLYDTGPRFSSGFMPLAGLWLFILRFVAPLGIAWILAQGLFE